MGSDRVAAIGEVLTAPDPAPGERRRPELPRARAVVVLALLVVQFAGLGLVEAWRDSLTLDEGVYLASGVTALTEHDLRVNPELPPLAKVLAAAPVLLARPVVPDTQAWEEGRWFDYAEEFIAAQDDAGRLRRVTFLGRLVPIALTVVTGLLAYAVAARMWGRLPALIAAGAWLTTPFVLGLGHLNAADVGFATATMLAALLLLRYVDAPGNRAAGLLGVGAGTVLLTRHAGLALAAGLVVAVVVAGRDAPRESARHVMIVTLAGLAVLWAGYRVVAPSAPDGAARATFAGIIHRAEDESRFAQLLLALPAPLEYRTGIAHLTLTDEDRPGYLLGRSWTGGQWWYWPAVVPVKLPPSVLLLAAAGIAGTVRARRRSRDRVLLVVALPAALLVAAMAAQPRTIGLRYLLPVLALGSVVCAGAIVTLRRRWGRWLIGAVAAAQVVFLWSAHPGALAWNSPFFRPAYRHVTDSDLDWGQDVRRLAEWAAEDGGRRPHVTAVLSKGVGLDAIPGARSLLDADHGRITGWVAVGATPLTATAREQLSWLRAYCPVDTVGRSILLYFLDEPPDTSPGPTRPAAPCPSGQAVSTRR